jgi:hypothetical protein
MKKKALQGVGDTSALKGHPFDTAPKKQGDGPAPKASTPKKRKLPSSAQGSIYPPTIEIDSTERSAEMSSSAASTAPPPVPADSRLKAISKYRPSVPSPLGRIEAPSAEVETATSTAGEADQGLDLGASDDADEQAADRVASEEAAGEEPEDQVAEEAQPATESSEIENWDDIKDRLPDAKTATFVDFLSAVQAAAPSATRSQAFDEYVAARYPPPERTAKSTKPPTDVEVPVAGESSDPSEGPGSTSNARPDEIVLNAAAASTTVQPEGSSTVEGSTTGLEDGVNALLAATPSAQSGASALSAKSRKQLAAKLRKTSLALDRPGASETTIRRCHDDVKKFPRVGNLPRVALEPVQQACRTRFLLAHCFQQLSLAQSKENQGESRRSQRRHRRRESRDSCKLSGRAD